MPEQTEAEEPRTLKVVTCINRRHPTRSCYGLIEDDHDVRIAHRQWHLDQETDREALRGGIKARDETIAKLREELSGYRRDVAAYTQEVAGFHGQVQRVETPIVPPQMQINRHGYSDDELDDEPDEPTPVDLDLPDPDLLHGQPTAEADPYAGEPAETPADDLDDDEDDAHTVTRTSSPSWAR